MMLRSYKNNETCRDAVANQFYNVDHDFPILPETKAKLELHTYVHLLT